MSIQKQKAFGLVELMLGLFIGTCLLTLMIRHYLTTKQHSADTAHVLAQASDQQLISELIRNSVRQAGFTPCAPIRWLTVGNSSKSQHLEAVTLNVGDKKALQISRMSEDFSLVSDIISSDELLVDADSILKAHEHILVADCFHAQINTIQSIKHYGKVWRVKLKNPLYYAYKAPVYIGEWLQERYFIDKNNEGKNALFYQLNHPEELSSQIKGLAVTLKSVGVKRLVGIDFLLGHGKILHIETAVRV